MSRGKKAIMSVLKRCHLTSRMLGQNTNTGCKRKTAPFLKKKKKTKNNTKKTKQIVFQVFGLSNYFVQPEFYL